MTPDEKYSFSVKGSNLTQPIQMQLYKKTIVFSSFLTAFLKSTFNFENLEKNMSLIAHVFPKLLSAKDSVT